ncbi:MAG TPA: carboxypeptidase-like regulatory domain-containing protein [Acidobacteriaceae bacterium]
MNSDRRVFANPFRGFFTILALFAVVLLSVAGAHAQTISVNGGSIQGSITDPSGAVVGNVPVLVEQPSTGLSRTVRTDSKGFYAIGPLNPGEYTVTVAAPGFSKLEVKTVIRTGTATNGNFKLTVGGEGETVQVDAGAVQINTDQVGVSAVITSSQLDSLPVNGRNFLSYAQLQPGVQIQNGDSSAGGFDPTKAGYSAISFSGTSGRTTRILLDGQDITDETVGTTIFNVTSGSVGEMQVNRSVADPSTEITSGGSVYASTRSGTNGLHGQLFYNFQDYNALFATVKGSKPPFQRNNFGGSAGGPIIRDKLFFFASSERLKQDTSTPTTVLAGGYFAAVAAAYPTIQTPSRDTYSAGRLDYNGPLGIHMFARMNYEANSYVTGIDYSTYANRDNVPGIAGGADFTTGKFTHSFRGSYEKFHNFITPNVNPATTYDPIPGVYLSYGSQSLRTGLNDNAPQATFQVDKQVRYDGSWTKGGHNLRYGGDLNRINGGGSAAFFGAGPGIYLSSSASSRYIGGPGNLGCGGVPDAAACSSDLLNGYHPAYFYVGNNVGVATETPAFGLPGGGQGDWRIGLYVSDAWKITPTFSLSIGLRYVRDTGRTDSDLNPIPCSAIVPGSFPGGLPNCSGSSPLLDQFAAGMSGKINQPNKNFAPQIGFNYVPAALNNKTSFRGGFGIFYESSVFNNNTFERNARLANGKFNQYNLMCPNAPGGGATSLSFPGRSVPVTQNSAGVDIGTMCNEPMSSAVGDILLLENDYKAAAAANAGPNPGFIGNTLTASAASGSQLFAPGYKSPYSINWNIGIQQEIKPGVVVTVDYVHSAGLRIGQSHDVNHVGDAAYLNTAAAQHAIAATLAACGVPSISAAITACPGLHPATSTNPLPGPATIGDFAAKGLDSLNSYTGGAPVTAYSLTPATGAAFPGVNPLVGTGSFQFPDGKSAYDGLQVNFREQKTHPLPGFVNSTLEISYAYSRFITSGAPSTIGNSDQYFLSSAYDNNSPGTYMGYGSLDRTHIFSFGGSATFKYGAKVGFIGRFQSAPPTSLTLDTTGYDGSGTGEIFQTDLTGDGTTGDFLPGTQQGAYSRSIKPGTLNKAITRYNATAAGQLTPAGSKLVSSGLLTAAQMTQLGAVTPTLGAAPSYAYPNPTFRQVDITVSYPIGRGVLHFLPKSVSLEPSIAFYNAFNFSNYSTFNGAVGTLLIDSSQAGSVNSPYDATVRNDSRTVRGTGSFSDGSPRSTEFQLKLNF